MEENNNNQERNNVCFENHCWKKCLGMLLASFLGGFLAFYFVADQMAYKYSNMHNFNPRKYEKRMFDDFERTYKREMKDFDKIMKRHHENMNKIDRAVEFNRNDLTMPFFMMDSMKIKTEFEDDNFRVIVDAKPFDNDINRVNYNVSGRKLTVFGSSAVKNKDFEQDVEFSQDFILPPNAETARIKKELEGKKIVISVPLKSEDKD